MPDVVAAFDFDGTLTRGDTLVPFLRRVAGTRQLVMTAGLTLPLLLRARLRDDRRDAAKAAVLRRVLAGREEAELRRMAQDYADHVVSHELRPEVVAHLESHRARGDQVVIVSASPTLYLDRVGERLGVDAVLATELEVDADGRLTGALVGANCRRDEKVRRLEAWLAGRGVRLYAYGDSRGDAELLARADEALRV